MKEATVGYVIGVFCGLVVGATLTYLWFIWIFRDVYK